MNVVRQDDDASNSGLLDLAPTMLRLHTPVLGGDDNSSHGHAAVAAETAAPACVHTPVLDGDTVRMPPPLQGKQRARKVSKNDAPWNRTRPTRSSTSNVSISSDESHGSVIVHDTHQAQVRGREWDAEPFAMPVPTATSSNHVSSQPTASASASASSSHTLPARLRRWMHDAMKQHLYETAIFWGQQVVALETSEAAYNDAYWLAQAYFLTHQYERAEQLLTTPLRCGAFPLKPNMRGETPVGTRGDALLAALAATRASSELPLSMQARRRHADTYASVSDIPAGADDDDAHVDRALDGATDSVRGTRAHVASGTGTNTSRRRKRSVSPSDPFQAPHGLHRSVDEEFTQLVVRQDEDESQGPCLVNWSSPCRYLAAQCQVRIGKLHEALELTGEDHTRWTGRASAKTPALDGGLKLGSSVCHLRGQIYLRLDEPGKAKEAFMLALALDVKNYDSFSALIHGSLLGSDEQWGFVQALEYTAQAGTERDAQDDMEWVRLMYTSQLSQRTPLHATQAALARQKMVDRHARMRAQPPVLQSLAESLWQAMRYEDAYAVTQHILALDPGFFLALPIHTACMYYLPRLRPALFLLAHKLTEAHPDTCEAWYAVGIWYASAKRWSDARRYFSKASLLDPRFVPSWIAFGHSFALEGESDQAITAYSTAARKFPQAGLPRLFIGMEHLAQGNRSLAQLFLQSAAEELVNDPLCANERGVALFQGGQIDEALTLFRQAIQAASETQHPASAWSAVHLNLGLAYRRLHCDNEARECFLHVIELDASCAPAYIALGMCAHRQGDLADAVGWYHEGLGIDPRDPIGTDLLAMALDARAAQGLPQALCMPSIASSSMAADETSASMDESSVGLAPA